MKIHEIRQRAKDREQLIIAAIRNGAYTLDDIARETDLKHSWVGQCLRKLASEYKVPNLAWLKKVLTNQKPGPVILKFANYDSITVAKTMRPELSADLLVQVLGREYCSLLIDALMVACVPPAVAEDETR